MPAMEPFLDAILSPINLPLTVVLGLAVAYWIIVIFSGLGFDALDIDLDPSQATDLDLDVDTSHGAASGASGGGGGGATLGLSMLRFLNLGEVPLMLWLSVLLLIVWAGNVALHPYLGDWAIGLQLLLLLPLLVLGLLVTKLLTAPLAVLFRKMREEERRVNNFTVIGQRCRVTTRRVTHTFGRAEITAEGGGAPIVLNVCTDNGDTLARGDEAVVVKHDPQRDLYLIRGF